MTARFDGIKMRILRRAAGLRHRDLGSLCNRDPETIVRLERGLLIPSRELAGRIAEVLGVPLDGLYKPPATAHEKPSEPANHDAPDTNGLTALEDRLLQIVRGLPAERQLDVLTYACRLGSAEAAPCPGRGDAPAT